MAAHSACDWLPSFPPGRGVCGLAEHLGPQLVCLKLNGEQLTDKSFGALRCCSRLETLFVSFAEKITDAGLASIKAGAGGALPEDPVRPKKKMQSPPLPETFIVKYPDGTHMSPSTL
ncbi:hypothetical protein HPB47_005423 [Ixodes persulcatus]|uniref:Uncharacterized protein n=1 Tax=Ixodes persulcatus TaxID=34615 RepID=A0AC60PD27_IXOPE|nr:hypothetical protein HPB47_005423 [Ixodes persulcatus]